MKRLFNIFKGSGWLNIFGMSIAFAAFYIVMSQVWYDFTFNRNIKDSEDVYIVGLPSWYDETKLMIALNRQLVPIMASNTPDIQLFGACGSFFSSNYHTIKNGERVPTPVQILQCDKGFAQTFGIEFISGSIDDLNEPGVITISESVAKKYQLSVGDAFVNKDPNLKGEIIIKSIFKDFPHNCILNETEAFQFYEFEQMPVNPSEWSYTYFVKLQHGCDPTSTVEAMFNALTKQTEQNSSIEDLGLALVPLNDLYFSDKLDNHKFEKGNKVTTITFLIIAILILGISLINAINFFMATIPIKIKTVNILKIFGSSRMAIIWSFVMESLIMVTISFAIAIVMIHLFKDSEYASLLSCGLDFSQNRLVLVITVVVAIAMALFSNLYPASYITSISPVMVVKGAFSSTNSGRKLRFSLIILQFTITIALLTGAFFLTMQHRYMMGFDMGFNKENLLSVELPYQFDGNYIGVENKMLQNPQITDVTFANGIMVAKGRMGWGRSYKGNQVNYQVYPVYPDFLRFMGIDIMEGRDFSDTDLQGNGVFIFTENAKSKFDLNLNDHMDGHNGTAEIIGFCKDFNNRPLQYGYEPFAFYVFGSNPWRYYNNVYIRMTPEADINGVVDYIRNTVHELYPTVPKSAIDVDTYDNELSAQYKSEDDLNTLINIFTALAMVISLLGVFGLVRIDTAYRKKEIGIRRVLGESIGETIILFNKNIVRLLVVSAVIAIPISYFVVDYYLSTFVYHIPIYWWIFVLAFLAVTAITITVVSTGCYKAATNNPVDSIKSE